MLVNPEGGIDLPPVWFLCGTSDRSKPRLKSDGIARSRQSLVWTADCDDVDSSAISLESHEAIVENREVGCRDALCRRKARRCWVLACDILLQYTIVVTSLFHLLVSAAQYM
jgi:hypothetical protein